MQECEEEIVQGVGGDFNQWGRKTFFLNEHKEKKIH